MNRRKLSVFSTAVAATFAFNLAASAISEAAIHSGVAQIYSGSASNYTCALLADRRLTCWGTNNSSGPPNFTFQEFPKLTSSSILSVSTGLGFACAQHADSTVWCWGVNDDGQLGSGSAVLENQTPSQVRLDALTPLSDVTQVAAGGAHACAVKIDGTAWCWGANYRGQLGNFNVSASAVANTPLQVVVHDPAHGNPKLGSVQSISSGIYTSCVLFNPDSSGSTGACWGGNTFGELGNGTTSSYSNTPLTIFSSASVPLHMASYAIGAGTSHTCSMIPNGTIGCWGDNSKGANSTKISGSYPWPATVYNGSVPLTTATSLSVGGSFTCALLNDSSAACWGANSLGEVGHFRLARANAFAPYPVINADGTTLRNIVTLVTGSVHACALTAQRNVYCWGDNHRAQLGQDFSVSDTLTDTDIPTLVPLDAPLFTDDFERN